MSCAARTLPLDVVAACQQSAKIVRAGALPPQVLAVCADHIAIAKQGVDALIGRKGGQDRAERTVRVRVIGVEPRDYIA